MSSSLYFYLSKPPDKREVKLPRKLNELFLIKTMIFLTQINSKKCFLLNVRKPAMINQYAIYSTLRNILQITVSHQIYRKHA